VQDVGVHEPLTPLLRRYAILQIVTAEEQEEAVLELLQRTGPCCLYTLVRSLPYLSWTEVFVAVDRMSRNGRLWVRRRGYWIDEITLPSQLASLRSAARQEEP
jgi:hypothetical protein